MRLLLITLIALFTSIASAAELRGYMGGEVRYFYQDPWQDQQTDWQASFVTQPEFYWDLDENGDNSLTFTPFMRLDSADKERSHWDIRELKWLHLADNWELEVGAAIVFWGVTESQHLVDVINQTDDIESINGEDKLGQPMIHFSWIDDWGVLETFILAGFRERTYAGEQGRLRLPFLVDSDASQYESSRGQKHIDMAVRYSQNIDDLDFGIALFQGTNRDPVLTFNPQQQNLTPYYVQMTQFSSDIQLTQNEWLWKLEWLYRDTKPTSYYATVAGFEYTLIGLFESNADLGLLSEYNWDERQDEATTPYQNDLFVGARLVLNDEDSSELLIGVARDLSYMSYSGRLQASKRIGERYKLSLEAWVFNSKEPADPLYYYQNDDMINLNLDYYF
ncbi:hypothetical protein CW745_05015 [Psychromonas sp. psych-6C06]|uniref:hypothetical protein n=1 Tax=Psychromonas sp. psych-6C06 TaxID=2058089 RepID=UPI000C33DD34|nr:hypothetical protein [Psychromonas sp. psych-6C06]PKF62785.1 hypothetical protein CW745_05015 [Psychromonas sp. psych-6C06]